MCSLEFFLSPHILALSQFLSLFCYYWRLFCYFQELLILQPSAAPLSSRVRNRDVQLANSQQRAFPLETTLSPLVVHKHILKACTLYSCIGHPPYGQNPQSILDALGKTSIQKKHFLSGIAQMRGGGAVYPCPKFLALFQEVHLWSIKRVYFFKNAIVLNF